MKCVNTLRRHRKASGLTQREVAKRMGLKNSSLISRWENGFSLPDLENAFVLAMIYDVMVDALFIDLRRSVQYGGATDRHARVNAYERKKTAKTQCREKQGAS